jgi:hypothetical protein
MPSLEQDDVWHDFHEAFLPRARDQIASMISDDYIVKIDEHDIHEPSAEQRGFLGRGDVLVNSRSEAAPPKATGATLEAPVHILLPQVDLERLAYLEIRDRRDRRW